MKSEQWKTYRTRFLVKAKQLNSSLSFIDHLGRQHCGRKGDYLVESCDGVISIAPRQIFEDIYVPMAADNPNPLPDSLPAEINDQMPLSRFHIEPLKLEVIREAKLRARVQFPSPTSHDDTPRNRRKSPQPARSGRPTHLSLM